MRKTLSVIVWLALFLVAFSPALVLGGGPSPFGLTVEGMSYEDVITVLKQRSWHFSEYDKKQLKTIPPDAAERGQNTFFRVQPKGLSGLRSMFLFFNPDRVLSAVMLGMDPRLFYTVKTSLAPKYQLVEDNSEGERLASEYPFVLWRKGEYYIELQKPFPHAVRLLYVNKLLHENYRSFLLKSYGPFKPVPPGADWIKDL